MAAKRKLRIATIVYWVLLLYIMAALGWWAYSLLQQNKQIHALQKQALNPSAAGYVLAAQKIEASERRGFYKYIGEGSAFLFLICAAAVYLYRLVRRQLQLQQQQQNFVMAVTHELKTPIAVARLNLETLQKHRLEEEKKAKLVQTTLQETLRLDTLINNILLASQLEERAYRTTKEELDFSALVKDVLKDFENRYPERPLTVSLADDVVLYGDATLLKLLLSNLLENANKYSPKRKTVSLFLTAKTSYLTAEAGDVTLTVADEGGGIPDEEKKAVFQKFYRIGAEETRKTQGTGLGLYICKKIAEDHGGKISVQDNGPTGSKFIVQFYAPHD